MGVSINCHPPSIISEAFGPRQEIKQALFLAPLLCRRKINHSLGPSRCRVTTLPVTATSQAVQREPPSSFSEGEGVNEQDLDHHPTQKREESKQNKAGIAEESLGLLEWPTLCKQVAAFAQTSSTAQHISQNNLSMGSSEAECEELLQQTAEAIQAKLKFEGIFDLRPMVGAASEGRLLNPRHLNALASTLEAAEKLMSQLGAGSVETDRGSETSTGGFASLLKVMAAAKGGAPDVLAEIRRCIGREGDVILDEADEDLALLREERNQSSKKLVTESEDWARRLFQAKVSEHDRVTQQRGRQCVSVKAGRQGELPRGSIKLGASRSGATVYMQPEPLVDLNNTYASLVDQVEEAEMKVLSQLTALVARHSSRLFKVANALLQMDIINARALYSEWISGVRPEFCKPSKEHGSVNLRGARHPLLLSTCLEGLPQMPEYDESEFENAYQGAAKALNIAVSDPYTQGQEQEEPKSKKLPRAIDLVVPPGKTSVVLTGPNTGGKTASLKTLGLLVLMAKAGLFLPVAHPTSKGSTGSAQESPSPGASHSTESGQSLVCFSEVLADLGDSQDLAQSLSTFSGHIQRVRRILEAAGPASLVLLDELGSGTDPVEGGALAAVILEDLAPRAALCFSTSHHAELKDLPEKDSRFVNACVEFDIKSLMPTYRLMWGAPGESQALAVAKGLGFDTDIVDAALQISSESIYIQNPGKERNSMKRSLVEELEEAEKEADHAHSQRRQIQKRLNQLQAELQTLEHQHTSEQVGGKDGKDTSLSTQRQIKQVMDSFTLGNLELGEAQTQLDAIKSAALGKQQESSQAFGKSQSGSEKGWTPLPGELVKLLTMGKKEAEVVSAKGKKLTVRLGNMPVEVKKSDVIPSRTRPDAPKPDAKSRRNPSAAKSITSKSKGAKLRKSGSSEVLRVQIEENTADLRGMRLVEAMRELDSRMHACPDNSVLFVIHGHGTGQIKGAVQRHLKGHAMVAKFSYEPESAGGCTIVEFK